MRRTAPIVALFIVAVLILLTAIYVSALPRGAQTITIIHTNDMHGYVEADIVGTGSQTFENGGMANLVGWIDQWRAANPETTLLLDAGDIWQGTYISNQSEGSVMVEAMNIAGYNAAAPGNHDFDFGQVVLIERIKQAQFPFLAANIVETSTGKPPSWLKPYAIFEASGVRVGVIGLGYPGTPSISKPANVQGLTFLSGAEGVQRCLETVRQQSDIVVVLSHLGLGDDEALAAAVPGIDVIVGGHTHIVQTTPKRVGNTIIVQAGSNVKSAGMLSLTYDRAAKKIVDYTRSNEVQPVVSNRVSPNARVDDLVKQKAAEAAALLNRPLGETKVSLQNCYSGECPLGNLVSDAMLAANQAGTRPADVAMHNNSGLRASLSKGPITYGALYQVLPFGNVLTAEDLTGSQILAILEKTVSGRPGNMVVSGMTYSFDQSKHVGSRILAATIAGKPLDPQRVYRVQTIDYLAGGGDGQNTFKEGRNLVYGDPVIDVVAEYIRTRSPVNPAVEGRITSR